MIEAAASSLLRPLANIILPIARKLRAERCAGKNPFPVQPEQDPLGQQLDAALARLGAIDDHLESWNKLLSGLGAAATRPDFFQLPSVREWLSDGQVKADFKSLARARLIGGDTDREALNRIRDKYSEATGEAKYRATYAIVVVQAVLQVSAHAALAPGEGVIAGMIRDATVGHGEKLDRIEAKLEQRAPAEDPLYGEKLQTELSRILSRRAIPGIKAADEIEALIARIESAELTRAPEADKAEAYYWAARILASDVDKAAQAKAYLETYKALPTVNLDNVAFIESWLNHAVGRTQDAINILSNIDTPDARTSLLILIAKRDGNTAALDWLADHQPYNHSLLSPVGWRNAVVMMAEEEQWQEAVDLLDVLPGEMQIFSPELLFIKGVIHACFLLPEPLRLRMLNEFNIDFKTETQEGEIASNHRKQAIQALLQAHELMLQLGAKDRARGCEYHMMWLRLTDPQERDAALAELKKGMADGEYAAFMLDIALNIDDTFDRQPLERYLRRRKREGREVPQDHAARLRLLQYFGTPTEVLTHLEEEAPTLKEILSPAILASVKLRALIDDERIADAEKELELCADAFSPDDLERHRLMFADRRGEELTGLEALYHRTGNYEDLLNLVHYLERTQQWGSLVPHAQALLETRRSASALRTLIHAMQKADTANEDIAACLNKYQELMIPGSPNGDDLLLSKGWALFSLGQFTEAQQIAEELATRTHAPNAISLEINLALRTGQWEHFAAIIDREYPRLAEFPSRLLLQMASVIADQDQDRSIEILRIAADKEPEDGSVQANAYWLASQIGRERDASVWLKRAIELSEQGKGPLQSVSLREMADMMPARAEQRREWGQKYSIGEIGIHPIASLLHVPVAQILVGQALHNENEIDPRRRSVIPARHGGRGITNLEGMRSIAFDLTSLLLLENLGILDAALGAFEHVYLSPRLMDILFQEHRQVRFHQPSLVEEAKRIREMIANGDIQLLQNASPPQELVEEAGDEMARLLHMAQQSGGRVLATLPAHKAGSLDHDEADLGTFGPLILKTTQFLHQLENQIAPNDYASAESFLSSVDRGANLGPDEIGDGPLYIDNLALSYLGTADVLKTLRHVGKDVFVVTSVDDDAKALIEGARHGDQVAAVIDRLRKRLRDGLAAGKVVFLPESSDREDHDEFHQTNALMDIFASIGDASAVCIDDRAIGKHANISDKAGRTVPMINSIDVLEHLAALGSITAEEKSSCDFRLRKGGFAFLPLPPGHVYAALMASADTAQGQLNENRDLIAIRENLLRIRSMKMLRLPEEVFWFSQLAQTSKQILAQIWDDTTIAPDMAESMSDWVIDVLSPLPTAWQESVVLAHEENIEEATKLTLLHLINLGLTLTDRDKRDAYTKWADKSLIQPLLPANASLVDELSQFIGPRIAKIAKEIADELD